MRAAALAARPPARAVAKSGEGPSPLSLRPHSESSNRPARYCLGSWRRCYYRATKTPDCRRNPDQLGLKIVHLDDVLVVIDKPAGLLSMGSDREKEKTSHRILNDYLKALTKSRLQQAFIVHRLDRETSGLMLFARSPAIQATLQANWKRVTKKYLAVVEGVPSTPQGTLTDRLVESQINAGSSRRSRRRDCDYAFPRDRYSRWPRAS